MTAEVQERLLNIKDLGILYLGYYYYIKNHCISNGIIDWSMLRSLGLSLSMVDKIKKRLKDCGLIVGTGRFYIVNDILG